MNIHEIKIAVRRAIGMIGAQNMKRSRGRPTGLKDGELRKRIVEVAADEFAHVGYAGARIIRIADAAGCDRALLYFYFHDKAGLFQAVLDEAARHRVGQMASQPETLAEGLIYWFRQNLSEPNRIRLLMQEALAEEPDAPTPPGRSSYLNKQLDVVKDFQSRNLLRGDVSPRYLLTVILALTSFPACFPNIASLSLEAAGTSLEETWSKCLTQMAELLSPPNP